MNGKQLRNSILQWAIQGKLVPQDPNDEPASVLLERIREEKARLVKEKKIKKDKNETIIYRGEDNSYYEKNLATGTVRCIDSEIPFDIPNGWEWAKIGNIFLHTSGKQQSRNNTNGSPHEFITTSNLYWGYFKLDNVKVMNFTDEEVGTCSAAKGDLLVCEGGAGYGRSAIWDKDYDICLQNHVHRLRPIVKGVCEYIYYLIYYLKESNQLASVGTAMPGLSANRLKEILVPVPPLKEQHRIVEKLQSVAPLLDRYTKNQTDLDSHNLNISTKFQKSILQEAIQGRLVPQIESEGTAEDLLAEIRAEKQRLVKEGKLKKSVLTNESRIFRGDDNRYYEIIGDNVNCVDDEIPFNLPNSWCWCRFDSLFSISSARRVHEKDWRTEGIPFYRAREIGKLADRGNVDNDLYIEQSLYDEFSKSGVPIPGDLMITAVGTLGKVYIVPENHIFYYKDGSVLCLNNLHNLIPQYVKMFINSQSFIQQYQADSDGTTVATLTMVRLKQYLIPLPPIAEQKRIVEKVNSFMCILAK